LTLSPSPIDHDAERADTLAVVFRGPKALCHEFSLVLEAKGIEHEVAQRGEAQRGEAQRGWAQSGSGLGGPGQSAGTWELTVTPALVHRAYEQISRYSSERGGPRNIPTITEPELFGGASVGAAAYALILLLTAYSAGIGLFGADWLSLGALDAGAGREWWRAVTALTLHLDQEHLLGNLLFGVFAGLAAGRLLGPGIAWASILGAGALANYVEILIAPATHRAVGASTAVFAALGLLAGMAWRQRLTLRERRWYRWAPLIAGICLLTLLGAGAAHVDVLGHALGFLFGVGVGWLQARVQMPRNRGRRLQIIAGAGAVSLVCVAWLLALKQAV
jgi:rhomboid protease GluP